MKRLFCLISLVVFAGFMAGSAQAAYVDLRPDTLTMPSNGAPYDPTDGSLSLQVWIMPSPEDTILDNWAFDIWFDTKETITYTGGTNILPTGWFAFSPQLVKDATPYVQNVEALTLGPGIPFPQQGVHAATLEFTFNYASLVRDGNPDFAVYYRPGQGMTVNGSLYAIKPDSIGPDLAPVPLPATAYLLGTGLLGLLGLRRRKSV